MSMVDAAGLKLRRTDNFYRNGGIALGVLSSVGVVSVIAFLVLMFHKQ